ncbi:hypothetical protein HI855_05905 [Cyanobacteria bacterium 150NLHA]|uniref:hypothetical protein n=1 Tax=Prochlorococcus sp. P1361 TaxID=2729589 RepID=UPI00145D4478|nr:hypothetical protein [Prochlorococcus sp. P1361]NMP06101.1 hypothetical protein [Prochlorococcus sp. P1361]
MMDRRHWSLLAVAALLIGVLSLLFVEIDLGMEEVIPQNPEEQQIPDPPETYGEGKILMGD